jgi:methyltransferase (TIGR00027 family)
MRDYRLPPSPPALPCAPPGAPPDGIPAPVLWAAAAHARESANASPYLRDPLAAEFADAAGLTAGPTGGGLLQQLLPDWIVVRSRFFDDHLLSATADGCRQVVLLGAGLDTRAFRLDWPAGVRVFEVDRPAVHDFKERVLAGRRPAGTRRTVVRADPAGSWAAELTAAGLDPTRPVAWLCETLLYHCAPESVETIVGTISELSASGSTLGAECVNADAVGSSFVAPFVDELAVGGISWRWQLTDPERWWAGHGWQARTADLFGLPYAVERFSPCLPLLGETDTDCVFLVTGTRP